MYGVKREIDLAYWAKLYEKQYYEEKKKTGRYPIYIDDFGKHQTEKSPYFETISKIFQKRGYLKKQEFISIGDWKTTRQRKRYKANDKNDVEEITQRAIHLDGDENKVKALLHLKGVGVPVASTILTIIFPRKYCIIDYRASRALKWYEGEINFTSYKHYQEFMDNLRTYYSVESYISYLKCVRKIAEEKNFTPRKVEMALYKYDQKSGER